jgi:WS/DGAT/MGAT family acyltransferase
MDQMSAMDAAFLYAESATTPMHIGGVAVFEGPPPSHDELLARFAAKIGLVPRYRQVVRHLPLDVGRPGWIDDEHFNLAYHVRRTAVPSPGGRAELDALVGRVMSQHLDLHRPLWEMWVVEGLEDGGGNASASGAAPSGNAFGAGQWAIVSKVHHCMVDGVASVDLMALLFDVERTPAPLPEPPPWTPAAAPSSVEIATTSLAGLVSPIEGWRRLAGALRTPRSSFGSGMEAARAIAGMAPKLLPPASTSLNGSFGPHRRWTSAHARLADVKAIRAGLGGTVNDVVLAAISRGFRDLLDARGELVDGQIVRSMVPVSVRTAEEQGVFANKVSSVFVDLPVGTADPRARLAAIRAGMDDVKRTKGAVAGARLTELSDFAPPLLLAAGQRLAMQLPQTSVHTVTTNVPGPQRPVYFVGRRMLHTAPTIPLGASMRTAVGIFSYNGTVTFGLTGDFDTVPDLAVLARGIESGIEELLELATAPAATDPATAPPATTDRATEGVR